MNGVPHGAEDCLYLNVFLPLHNIDQVLLFFSVATYAEVHGNNEGSTMLRVN